MILNPFLIIISMFLGIFGGWLACIASGLVTTEIYVIGVRYWFEPYTIFYALVKTVVFAFIISSVSAYHGYVIQGGALDVGKASTKAVVNSSILIIVFNLILTQLLLV